jgi:virginiamycin B lyase
MATILLLAQFAFAGESDIRSGVVKPKVSTLTPVTVSTAPDIIEYTLPKKYSIPYGIAIDAKDRIWFTEMAEHVIAVLDQVTNELKEYRIPSTADLPEVDWNYDPKTRGTPLETVTNYSVGSPGSMIVDKDGIIWCVTQLGNSILRFDPDKEEFTEFIVPTEDSRPYDLVSDSKGRIWFVLKNSGALGRLDYDNKKIVEIGLGTGSNPMAIAVDEEDNIWFSDSAYNYIGRYNPEKKSLRRFEINVPNAQPGEIKFMKDGILIFSQVSTKQIGVLMPEAGAFSVIDIPGYNAVPQGILPTGDKVWMVDSMMNRIGFFDMENLFWSIFSLPTPNAQPMKMAVDSRGNIWFTESGRDANRIAVILPSTLPKESLDSGASSEKRGRAFSGSKKGQSAGRYAVGLVVALVLVAGAIAVYRRKGK